MEDWVIIEDFPNYSICKDGVIMNNETGYILKPAISTHGYYVVNLMGKFKKIHRLLALAFIPNPENKEYIDHINRNRLDNRLENLRWATRFENGQNQSIHCNNALKEQNICIITQRGNIYYKYTKQINHKRFKKIFKTLQEAIDFRDAL
jgi:hypothetical protein